MSTYSALRGPAPKPASQRRRRTKPESYGAAEPTVAGQADAQPPLGFDAHELVVDLRAALGRSVEGRFYSAADWQRARLELWFAHKVMTAGAGAVGESVVGGPAWSGRVARQPGGEAPRRN